MLQEITGEDEYTLHRQSYVSDCCRAFVSQSYCFTDGGTEILCEECGAVCKAVIDDAPKQTTIVPAKTTNYV